MKALVEGGEVIEPLGERILGRVLCSDVIHPDTGNVLYTAGYLLNEDAVDSIESLGVDEVNVRTPLSCENAIWVVRKSATVVTWAAALWLILARPLG
jgi:DNA-directed RNA polymerase subunit beta'